MAPPVCPLIAVQVCCSTCVPPPQMLSVRTFLRTASSSLDTTYLARGMDRTSPADCGAVSMVMAAVIAAEPPGVEDGICQ